MGLISGVLKGVTSAIAGNKMAKIYQNVYDDLGNARSQGLADFNRENYADATQLADVQRSITEQKKMYADALRSAEAKQMMGGLTEEAVAANKAAAAQAVADTASQIAASSVARKDRLKQNFQRRDDMLAGQQRQMQLGKAEEIKGALMGVGDALGSIGNAVEDKYGIG